MPGMRNKQPGMSPEKMAMAVAVTMAAMAGMGAMKNVTGTSKAVAMVAVRPGTEPTNSPYKAAATITIKTCRFNTMPADCTRVSIMQTSWERSPGHRHEPAPGQRHTQQLIEQRVNDQAERQCEQQSP